MNDLLYSGQLRKKEVNWYLRNGKHPERITTDANGNEYVIGDWAWNKKMKRKTEFIERRMKYEIELGI